MINNLTWQEKFARLNQLDPNIALKIRTREKVWYISSQIQIASNGTLDRISASGPSAEKAVENFWSVVTDTIPNDAGLVVGLNDNNSFRWNGFKWEKISVKQIY